MSSTKTHNAKRVKRTVPLLFVWFAIIAPVSTLVFGWGYASVRENRLKEREVEQMEAANDPMAAHERSYMTWHRRVEIAGSHGPRAAPRVLRDGHVHRRQAAARALGQEDRVHRRGHARAPNAAHHAAHARRDARSRARPRRPKETRLRRARARDRAPVAARRERARDVEARRGSLGDRQEARRLRARRRVDRRLARAARQRARLRAELQGRARVRRDRVRSARRRARRAEPRRQRAQVRRGERAARGRDRRRARTKPACASS